MVLNATHGHFRPLKRIRPCSATVRARWGRGDGTLPRRKRNDACFTRSESDHTVHTVSTLSSLVLDGRVVRLVTAR